VEAAILAAALLTLLVAGYAAWVTRQGRDIGEQTLDATRETRDIAKGAREDDREARLHDQLARVAELLTTIQTIVREDEAQGEQPGQRWMSGFQSARRQLDLALTHLVRLGGPELAKCRELATLTKELFPSSTKVEGSIWACFEEIERARSALD
jgi:hypothetical protein